MGASNAAEDPLGVLVGLLLGPWALTTSASEATYSYDVPNVVRVGVHTFGVAEANPTQLSDVWKWSGPPAAALRGPSTTSSSSLVATNTVDAQLGQGLARRRTEAGLPVVALAGASPLLARTRYCSGMRLHRPIASPRVRTVAYR